MPKTKIFTNFTAGEISPKMQGRKDLAKYYNGAQEIENFIVHPIGGVERRPGTRFAAETKDSTKQSRLIPFEFNQDQSYALEFGEEYVRVFRDGAPVTFSGSIAFPQIKKNRTRGSHALTTSHDLNIPPTTAAGDLLIAFLTVGDNAQTITWPSPWTVLASEDNTNHQTEIAYKISAGGENPTVTVTVGSSVVSVYVMLRITGHDPLIAPEASSVDGGTSSHNANPPPLDPVGWGQDKNLWIAAVGTGAMASTSYSLPANYSLMYSQTVASTCGIATCHRALEDNVENPNAIVLGLSARWTGFTVVVKPASITGPLEIPTPYLESELGAIQYRQSADVMYLVHNNHPPHKLSRTSDISWVMAPVNFIPPPTYEADTEFAAVLSPAATTGLNIVFDADASVFVTSDVGRMIISGAGKAIIIARDSATQVHADIIDDFISTDDIPAGSWFLRNSPQAKLDPGSNKGAINSQITMTLSSPATGWRDEDVGKYVKVYGGVIKITSVTSTSAAKGTLLSKMSEVNTTNPAAAPIGSWTLEVAAWSPERGFPGTIEFHEGRLAFYGTPAQPTTFWASRSNDYENMATGSLASDAIEYTIASRKVNQGRWLASFTDLLLGDANNEHLATGPGSDEPLGGDVLPHVDSQSTKGSAFLQAMTLSEAVMFIQAALRKIYMINFSLERNRFQPIDITKIAEHITAPSLASHPLDYAAEPNSQILAIRSDGQLLSCTFDPDEQVVAWSRIVTDGEFESVTVIPTSGGPDQIWVIVNRTIDSEEKRYVEFFDTSAFTVRGWPELHTDSAVVFTTPVSGFVACAHLEGKTVDIIRNGLYIGTGMVSGGVVSIGGVPATELEIGLHYNSRLKTMKPSLERSMVEGYKRRWLSVCGRYSRAMTVNVQGREVVLAPVSGNPTMFTGDKKIDDQDWSLDGSLVLLQTKPLPCGILAIFGEVEFADVMG